MSIGLIDWALKQNVKPSAAKFVLVALANYADENDFCYPSQSRLAADTGQSERSVRAHIAQLEKDGWIKKDQRRRPNGSFTSDAFTLQRQISPAANLASGKKQRQPAAKSAGPEPSLEPSLTADDSARDLNRLEGDLREAAGACLNDQSFTLHDLSRPLAWLESGCDWNLDVLAAVKAVAARASPKSVRGWKYFEPAVADAKASRLTPMQAGTPNPKPFVQKIYGTKPNGNDSGSADDSNRTNAAVLDTTEGRGRDEPRIPDRRVAELVRNTVGR